MKHDTEFKRIYEAANYAGVEDTINDLDRVLTGGDSNEVGYGIARNNTISGSIRDVERVERTVANVKGELDEIESGIKQYEKTFSRVYGATNTRPRQSSYNASSWGSRQLSRSESLASYTTKVVR